MTVHDRPVSEVMQRDVVTLGRDDRLDLADDIMKLGRVRQLPVVDGERLVGIVSQRDLLAASLTKALDYDARERRAFLRTVEVAEVMTEELVSVGPDATCGDAARLMIRKKIGGVPVAEGGRLVGLVTETDLLRAAYDDQKEGGTTMDLPKAMDDELQELRALRDELRVQVELGKAEARDLWGELEQRWSHFEARARSTAGRMEEPLEDIGDAAELLVDEVRKGYKRIRELLQGA